MQKGPVCVQVQLHILLWGFNLPSDNNKGDNIQLARHQAVKKANEAVGKQHEFVCRTTYTRVLDAPSSATSYSFVCRMV
jgi:hypothetical protein